MSHFSVMLLPDHGQTKTYRLSKGKIRLLALFVFLVVASGVAGAYSLYVSYEMRKDLISTQETLENERIAFTNQKTMFEASLKAEQNKMNVYARTVGEMQARLARLDSLGKRLMQDSSLDPMAFNFDVQPAFGGPRSPVDSHIVDLGLFGQLEEVESKISILDTRLVAINYLLQDDIEEKNARPHAWPSEGGWLSSKYGIRTDPFTAKKAMHKGIDIANRFGAPVLSGSRGVVVYAGKMRDYGYLVEIEHGYGYRTRYGHMSAITVTAGDIIDANQMVGRIGSSGRSTGPHLHYEVRRNNKTLNPSNFIPKS
ncbi:MAG: M23 family metallopeptidase [Ghiorsea sp.]|nr:M23 family metallopeptidase [Ghiorsea sp.]